jgi:hypothetical protein
METFINLPPSKFKNMKGKKEPSNSRRKLYRKYKRRLAKEKNERTPLKNID